MVLVVSIPVNLSTPVGSSSLNGILFAEGLSLAKWFDSVCWSGLVYTDGSEL